MSLAQEKIIKNYIYQIRAPFSLQEVHENTGVPKTSTFRILHNLLESGDIVKTCAAVRPQKYKVVIRISKDHLVSKGDLRQDEVKEKAEKLGVSSRTVYRIEKRVAAGRQEDPFNEPSLDTSKLYPYMQEILKKAKLQGMVKVKDVTESIGCDEEQAYQVLRYLETNKYLEMAQESQDTFKPSERMIS